MKANKDSKWFLLCMILIFGVELIECSVTYDKKALIINGQRRILFSGSINYQEAPQNIILKEDMIWFGSSRWYKKQGYICIFALGLLFVQSGTLGSNFLGFPVWLKYVPGISFRTDNEPFKMAMQSFTQKIVQMMKDEKLFESQGGPIILSQACFEGLPLCCVIATFFIENEYGFESKKYGSAGYAYLTWAAKMAVDLGTGVPWVMCKEDDAPDPVINTCNGFYCDYFSPNKPYKPTMWTEAWSGWFADFGGPIHQRPVEDLAFGVARFIQKGGSLVNYYMYHGGTNFGRTAGGPFITTSYDYDAPIDEYGLIRQPKYDHLKELHRVIKLCEQALVAADPAVTSLGTYEQAHVFSSNSGGCAAFLSNYHFDSAARVTFRNMQYKLPPWSISVLPDCKNAVFNTAQVGVKTSRAQMLPTNAALHSWETFNENIYSGDVDSRITFDGLREQLNITRDASDYLWYMTNQQAMLCMYSSMDVYQNNGAHFETWNAGILGPVVLYGLDNGKRDLSWQKWSYQVGLKGEAMNLESPSRTSSVDWMGGSSLVTNKQQPLTWYKAYFDSPMGYEPLALDMNSMGKGQVWINGQSLGRYWTAYAKGNCSSCIYSGTYRPTTKCQFGCGQPTQRWYHAPRSWLKPTHNLLVVFEEIGGDATRISIVKRSVSRV
ncbi:hypothetical protein RJ640_017110 [Escallonia rubra]|uniref:beta-galactosidase n=1 Tax=Escallonia rubra TaxID=112253 RepID=A0AA88QWE3_9ASTE|nr:hypothetical protein RJ640_017110 [Escallonia rubra]